MDSSGSCDFQAELTNWCEEVLIDKTHAILLVGVSTEVEVAHIEDVTQSVKAWGKVRVRATKESSSPFKQLVLCECRETINPELVHTELLSAKGEEPWKVFVVQRSVPTPGDFEEKLARFLVGEGMSLAYLQGLVSPSGPSTSSPEAIIRALGDLLEKTGKPASDNVYRRLRTFSGTVPTPHDMYDDC